MSVVEAEKRMNRASIDSEIFELASRHHIARLFWNLIMAEKTEIEIFYVSTSVLFNMLV